MDWTFYKPHFEYEEAYNDLGGPWSGHKYFSYDLIRNIKPGRIVELGTHLGCSLFSFSQAVKDGCLKTKVDGIDTWQGDKHSGKYGELILSRVNEIKKTYYPKTDITFIRTTFDKASLKYKRNSIDILHIDGLHTYNAVKHDYQNWYEKVKDVGIILFHDIAVKKWGFGIYKLWEEIKKEHPTIEFEHSYGLGVMFKNRKTYQEIIKNEKYFTLYYSLLAEHKDLKWESLKDKEVIKWQSNRLKNIESNPLYTWYKLLKRITRLSTSIKPIRQGD